MNSLRNIKACLTNEIENCTTKQQHSIAQHCKASHSPAARHSSTQHGDFKSIVAHPVLSLFRVKSSAHSLLFGCSLLWFATACSISLLICAPSTETMQLRHSAARLGFNSVCVQCTVEGDLQGEQSSGAVCSSDWMVCSSDWKAAFYLGIKSSGTSSVTSCIVNLPLSSVS